MFEEAKAYEYVANKGEGDPFYWSGDEPLLELERPERMDEIKRKWTERQEHLKTNGKKTKLINILGDGNEDEGDTNGCLICQL